MHILPLFMRPRERQVAQGKRAVWRDSVEAIARRVLSRVSGRSQHVHLGAGFMRLKQGVGSSRLPYQEGEFPGFRGANRNLPFDIDNAQSCCGMSHAKRRSRSSFSGSLILVSRFVSHPSSLSFPKLCQVDGNLYSRTLAASNKQCAVVLTRPPPSKHRGL